MYVSKAFLPHGRRPHVKQLCARTCPVLPVQRELCKNISSSDRYHFVQKHPQGYYKKKTALMFQQPLCQERCSPAFLLTCRKYMIIPCTMICFWYWYWFSTSPRLLSTPFYQTLFLQRWYWKCQIICEILHLWDSEKYRTKPQCNKKSYRSQHFITTG